MYKVLAYAVNVNLSLEQVLMRAEVSLNDYMKALEVSSVVVLRHEPSECCINNYNSPIILAWQANMDLQYAYACVMYSMWPPT